MMKRNLLSASLFLIVFLGSQDRSSAHPRQQTGSGSPSPAAAAADDEYRMCPGDVIEVRFFFNPELNEQVQIRPDGRISLQLMGDVHLAGLSTDQAVKMLHAKYSDVLSTPRITIQIRS